VYEYQQECDRVLLICGAFNDAGATTEKIVTRCGASPCVIDIVAIGNPERHVRKASHRGSKQQ